MMSDIEIESELVTFVEQARLGAKVWALSAEDGGVVVCESNQFENADVLLLWDSEEKAKSQCKDEWQEYAPMAIDLDELLDEWVEDLNEDQALFGLNWNDENVCVEIEPTGLARALCD
jgi:hypothetical protein